MSRALRPRCIDELIVHVLLRIIDHFLDVARYVVDESPESDGVAQCQVVVIRSNCRVQITNKHSNEVLLVEISDRHFDIGLRLGYRVPRAKSTSAPDVEPGTRHSSSASDRTNASFI